MPVHYIPHTCLLPGDLLNIFTTFNKCWETKLMVLKTNVTLMQQNKQSTVLLSMFLFYILCRNVLICRHYPFFKYISIPGTSWIAFDAWIALLCDVRIVKQNLFLSYSIDILMPKNWHLFKNSLYFCLLYYRCFGCQNSLYVLKHKTDKIATACINNNLQYLFQYQDCTKGYHQNQVHSICLSRNRLAAQIIIVHGRFTPM